MGDVNVFGIIKYTCIGYATNLSVIFAAYILYHLEYTRQLTLSRVTFLHSESIDPFAGSLI
ncbi:hypothetical protein CLV84_0478 [Neolewinella xylanilytica]|uniref:Uncharacterized protein n=1 Tax=Neolewinella xylanilytica TaxID=1514080 RepID=A0A2S6I7S5_9BACT|nr:hypothetical protein CLV84_0478 [Neolewinella xylanilytica]